MTARTGMHELVAIRYATLTTTRSALYLDAPEPDGPAVMDYFLYVVRDGPQVIVVDTGFSASAGRRRGRRQLGAPLDLLRRVGVDPAAVETLVLTHLHYDHTGNVAAFTGARRVVVAGAEIAFWRTPVAEHPLFASVAEADDLREVYALHDAGRTQPIDGRVEIVPGLVAHVVGGHSPGQMILQVATAGGEVLLAGDAAHFSEELEHERPFRVVADLPAMVQAYRTIRALATASGAIVVPGHDPAVMERFAAPSRDLDGLAVVLTGHR